MKWPGPSPGNEVVPARAPVRLRDLAIWHLKGALALLAFLALYPVKYHVLKYNFDSFWVAALNYLHTTGAVFGKDIEITYGPLAYLTLPMPFGNNIEQGIAFQVGSWLVLGALLVWLLFGQRIPPINWLILAVCAPAGAQLLRASTTDGPDYFLEVLVVLLTASSVAGPVVLYFAAVAIASILLLIKLSGGLAAFGVILMFPIAMALTSRARAARLLCIGLIGVPSIVVALFLATGGTLSALLKYFRAGFEISSGYNSAMSLDGPSDALFAALILLAGFVAIATVLYFRKDRAFPIAVAVFPLLFLEFKHSFVRQDGHVEILFKLAPLILAAILLLADLNISHWDRRSKGMGLAALVLIAASWLYFERGHYYFHKFAWEESSSPFASLARVGDLTNLAALNQRLWEQSALVFEHSHFPRPLRERLGDHTVAIYPGNFVYAATNGLRLIPFPVLQSYSAYTTYLDEWDAEFVRDIKHRPELVLFDWLNIDKRHPLLDCPQTTLALYQNYEFDSSYGGLTVLRARPEPLSAAMRFVRQTTMTLGQPLHLEGEHDSVIRILLKYNLRGRMAEFFFRIPPVYATLSGPNGRSITHRIPPGVLSGGVPLRIMPADLEDARRLFETGRTAAAFDSIALSGPGIVDFAPIARVDVYEGSGSTESSDKR